MHLTLQGCKTHHKHVHTSVQMVKRNPPVTWILTHKHNFICIFQVPQFAAWSNAIATVPDKGGAISIVISNTIEGKTGGIGNPDDDHLSWGESGWKTAVSAQLASTVSVQKLKKWSELFWYISQWGATPDSDGLIQKLRRIVVYLHLFICTNLSTDHVSSKSWSRTKTSSGRGKKKQRAHLIKHSSSSIRHVHVTDDLSGSIISLWIGYYRIGWLT